MNPEEYTNEGREHCSLEMDFPNLINNVYNDETFLSAAKRRAVGYGDTPLPYSPYSFLAESPYAMNRQQRPHPSSRHPSQYFTPFNGLPFPHSSQLSFDIAGNPRNPDSTFLPKFPPQTFEIPDIQDSNSVFGEGGIFDQNGGYRAAFGHSHLGYGIRPSMDAAGYVNRPHAQVVPPEWLPPMTSSTGSANSSPVSQSEEVVGFDQVLSSPPPPPPSQFSVQPMKANGVCTEVIATTKKVRSPKKRKRKDPNEPQKPVSAYSLFFRNAQAAIKCQNPNATFGDVSKIVASMWDGLDDQVKNFYKRQMEVAKKEYLKQLAVYKATLEAKDNSVQSNADTDQISSTQNALPQLHSIASNHSIGDEQTQPQQPNYQKVVPSQCVTSYEAVPQQQSRLDLSVTPSANQLAMNSQVMQKSQPIRQDMSPPIYFQNTNTGTSLVDSGQSARRMFAIYNQQTLHSPGAGGVSSSMSPYDYRDAGRYFPQSPTSQQFTSWSRNQLNIESQANRLCRDSSNANVSVADAADIQRT